MKAKKLLALLLSMAMVFTMMTALTVTSASAVVTDDDLLLNLDFTSYNGEATVSDTTGNLTVNTEGFVSGTGRLDGQSSIKFDGNQRIKWRCDDYDPFAHAEDGLTISAWMKYDVRIGWTQYFAYKKERFEGQNSGFVMQGNGDGNRGNAIRANYMYRERQFDLQDGCFERGEITMDNWVMVTYTQDNSGTVKIYVNGQEMGSRAIDIPNLYTLASSSDSNGMFSLGAPLPDEDWFEYWSPDSKFNGTMANFSVYGKTLTAGEIESLYDPTKAVDPEKVANVENLINAIGTVTLSDTSLNAIKTAKAAYNELNASEKETVSNYGGIATAYDTYYTLAEAANDGKAVYFDFENENALDIEKRIDATVSGVTVAPGKEAGSKAYQFDTTKSRDDNMYIRWDAGEYNPFARGNNGISIATWIKAADMNDFTTLFSFGKTGNHAFVIVPRSWNNGGLRAAIKTGETETDIVGSRSLIAEDMGEWALVTFTQDTVTKEAKLYINDELVATATLHTSLYDLANGNLPNDAKYSLGYVSFYNDNNMQGSMDDFAIYNKVLSVDDIAELLNPTPEIPEELQLSIAISSKTESATASDINKQDIVWNATVLVGGLSNESAYEAFNNSEINIIEYGVFYGTSRAAVGKWADLDTDPTLSSTLRKSVFGAVAEGETEINMFTTYGFRLRNCVKTAVRAAAFYVTYEFNGTTKTIISGIDAINEI